MRQDAEMFHSSFSVLKQWRYLLSVLICTLEVGLSQVSISIIPLRPAVGDTVFLVVDYKREILNINWYRGRGTADRINILTFSPGSEFDPTPGPQYTGREKVLDNGTLKISDLMTNYSGAYTLQLTIPDGHSIDTVELTVEFLICIQMKMTLSELTITINPPKPISGQTVFLQFYYPGEIFIINWYRGSGTAVKRNILTYSPGFDPTPGDQYTWREKIVDNGTLEISNIITNYSGSYTLQISTPNGLQSGTTELTVVSGIGNKDNVPEDTSISTSIAFLSLTTTAKSIQDIGQTYSTLYVLIITTVTVIVIVIGILVFGIIIWKKRKQRSLNEPVYEDEPRTEREMETRRSMGETIQPSEYLDNNMVVYEEVTFTNNSVVPNNAENPYTDLTYIQLSSDYQDLRRLNQ
ncbi:carcinoembryonic antigen-related cell adhesion molecule 3 isoform X1 [Xenopus tropicalis]|uniref:Carcinoembryonic antigen-related cell adhesion molecule 3 isoform X1 n=1 Tax=Xenopus tropicalis TaxID=8364 RepID=A0A8J0SVP0_XENTR|nr:carcinoembryonic antigen-related cell adhesion molecule 3 isoform X1 [Xenopus tropicalis]